MLCVCVSLMGGCYSLLATGRNREVMIIYLLRGAVLS